jgi:hypothetical protein
MIKVLQGESEAATTILPEILSSGVMEIPVLQLTHTPCELTK